VAILAAVAACGGSTVREHRVLVSPRLELTPYGRVALVRFTAENAQGPLAELATTRFSEDVLEAQRGTEVLEVGAEDTLVTRVGEREFGPASATELGRAKNVLAVFVGHLKVSGVKPSVGLLNLAGGAVTAKVSAELTVQLLSTTTGSTLWRSSAAASDEVGEVALISGQPMFAAQDPKAAYGRLVNQLVGIVTRDLRPTWREERY
jgi:hypothetical protein